VSTNAIKITVMHATDYLAECAATPEHLPALLSRFLIRFMRLRMPEMSLESAPTCDTSRETGGGHDAGPETILGSPLAAALASLQDDQNHLVPGLDMWFDWGSFDV
jgi:hypothetical protein